LGLFKREETSDLQKEYEKLRKQREKEQGKQDWSNYREEQKKEETYETYTNQSWQEEEKVERNTYSINGEVEKEDDSEYHHAYCEDDQIKPTPVYEEVELENTVYNTVVVIMTLAGVFGFLFIIGVLFFSVKFAHETGVTVPQVWKFVNETETEKTSGTYLKEMDDCEVKDVDVEDYSFKYISDTVGGSYLNFYCHRVVQWVDDEKGANLTLYKFSSTDSWKDLKDEVKQDIKDRSSSSMLSHSYMSGRMNDLGENNYVFCSNNLAGILFESSDGYYYVISVEVEEENTGLGDSDILDEIASDISNMLFSEVYVE
jgi:hypothetical protein